MKYLALLILLFAVPAHPFEADVTAIVDGRIQGGVIARQLNILDDGRNLHDYRWSVKNPKGYTYIDYNATGPPLNSHLEINVEADTPIPARVAEKIEYRMESPFVVEVATRKVKFSVEAMNFESNVDFGTGDHQMSAVGDGRFDIRGFAAHDDPVLCEAVAFRLRGRGLFDLDQDDNIIPTPYSEDPVPVQTLKSRLCPWVNRDADGQAVVSTFG